MKLIPSISIVFIILVFVFINYDFGFIKSV